MLRDALVRKSGRHRSSERVVPSRTADRAADAMTADAEDR
jgi:hypothetical protein